MSRHFDAIVIGAGQAGPPLAEKLAAAGSKVAVIERHYFGGTCINTGCRPTKTLVASAYAIHTARRGADYGFKVGGVEVDFARVKARARKIATDGRANIESWLRGIEGCTVIHGHARFTGPREVTVNGEALTAGRIFINVGGRALVPPMPGINQVPVLTNSSLLDLDELPRHLVIVGGSYIGLEFAQAYRRFGSEVTVIEKGPRLIGREDPETSDAIREMLEAEGISFRLAAECISFAPDPAGVRADVDCESGDKGIHGSHVLLAVGRRPNTDDLGLDTAGIEIDQRGFIKVNDRLETSAEGIWAIGECNGRGAFTHTAYNDFEIVAANLLEGGERKVTDRIMAYALFTDPPLGRVGMSEAEARAAGKPFLVGRRPMARVGRAVEKDETTGFMKILVDAESKAILGAAILGTSGDEAIHSVLDMMYAGAPVTTLQRAVHIHPTVAELVPTIAQELKPAD